MMSLNHFNARYLLASIFLLLTFMTGKVVLVMWFYKEFMF